MGSETSNYSLYKPEIGETGWGTSVNDNFDTIDGELNTRASKVGGATEDNLAALTASGDLQDSGHPWSELNPLPHAVVMEILGDKSQVDTSVHFQLQVDASIDFSAPEIDAESKDAQTNWYYFDWTRWQDMPAGGVLAYWKYEANTYDVPVLKPCNELDVGDEGYTNSRAMYKIPDDATLTPGTFYYYRWRQHDGLEYGPWHGGAFQL